MVLIDLHCQPTYVKDRRSLWYLDWRPLTAVVSVPFSFRVLPSPLWVVEGKRIMFHKLIMYTENLWSPLEPGCLELFVESPLKAHFSGCRLYCCCLSLSCGAQTWRLSCFQFFPNGSFSSMFYLPVPKDSSCPLHQLLEALVISKGIICLHSSDKRG